MGAELSLRNLRQVERGIEQALRNFTRGEGNGIRPLTIAAHEPIDKMSALAIAEVGETTANEIEQTGQAAVRDSAEIMKEAQQLATDLRACRGLRCSLRR